LRIMKTASRPIRWAPARESAASWEPTSERCPPRRKARAD